MRTYIFIDGNNFYFKLRVLTDRLDRKYKPMDFNFRTFSEWLVQPNTPEGVSYYIGTIRQQDNNEKSKKLYTDQQCLLRKLQRQKVSAVLGHLSGCFGPRKFSSFLSSNNAYGLYSKQTSQVANRNSGDPNIVALLIARLL